MPDYNITSPLDKEVLALYHAHALTDAENALVENLLTEEDHVFLKKLDSTMQSLHTYKNAEFSPSEDTYQRISENIAQLSPRESSSVVPPLSPQSSSKSRRSFRSLRPGLALVAAVCACFFGYKLLYPTHHSSVHNSEAITVPLTNTDVFPIDKHNNQSVSRNTRTLYQQAATCITHLTHNTYTAHQILAVSPIHNTQYNSNIIVRLSQPGRALRITTSSQCLTHPEIQYPYDSKVITF